MANRQVPFFEYPRLWSDDREDFLRIIDEVSSTGGFILQKAVSDFESELANYAGVNYSVGVGNATDGMEIFFISLDQKLRVITKIALHTTSTTTHHRHQLFYMKERS